jgi:hypothetical protein
VPFLFTERRIANAILAVDVPLAFYAAYLLSNQSETLTGPGGFRNGTALCLPVLFWGLGMGESRSRRSLTFPLLCLATLLFTIPSANHSALLTIAAFALLVVGGVWNWLGKKTDTMNKSGTDSA